MKNQVFLRAQLRELATNEISALLGPHRYAELTHGDEQPLFVSMVIAHEGQSRGEVKGRGAKLKEWGKKAVRACVRAFRPQGRWPVPIYDGFYDWHGNEGNRQPVGENVHSRLIELQSVEAAENFGYIYPEQTDLRAAIRNGERDICSLEADAIVVESGGRLFIEDVERGTGFVLGLSSRQMPGFPLARVQQLCEFEPVEGSTAGGSGVEPPKSPVAAEGAPSGGAATGTPAPALSKAQLIEAAKAAGVTAADLGVVTPAPAAAPAPIPAPVGAPPEKPAIPTVDEFDLSNPANNPFLPV